MNPPKTPPSILCVHPNGNVTTIYAENLDLRALGRARIDRASTVEPNAQCEWIVDLARSQGPQLGPYATRSEALAAERDWLERKLRRADEAII